MPIRHDFVITKIVFILYYITNKKVGGKLQWKWSQGMDECSSHSSTMPF